MTRFRPSIGHGRSTGATRAEMDAALQSMVATSLRPAGFSGSLPHLRRTLGERVDLISFQFFSSGGSFVVEVACVPPEGVMSAGRPVPASKVRATNVSRRPRLGSSSFPNHGDHWFVFGPRNYEEPSEFGYPSPDELAAEVLGLLQVEAELWWSTKPFPQKELRQPGP
jgi:hypothetical protein